MAKTDILFTGKRTSEVLGDTGWFFVMRVAFCFEGHQTSPVMKLTPSRLRGGATQSLGRSKAPTSLPRRLSQCSEEHWAGHHPADLPHPHPQRGLSCSGPSHCQYCHLCSKDQHPLYPPWEVSSNQILFFYRWSLLPLLFGNVRPTLPPSLLVSLGLWPLPLSSLHGPQGLAHCLAHHHPRNTSYEYTE